MKDLTFEYQLLSRLQMDCEYFIKTAKNLKHLWAGNVKDQIQKMKDLWHDFEIKPEWLSWNEILQYEKQMTAIK